MLTAYLVVWVCTSAAMDDCQAYAEESWQGSQALTECHASAPLYRRQLLEAGERFSTAECVTE